MLQDRVAAGIGEGDVAEANLPLGEAVCADGSGAQSAGGSHRGFESQHGGDRRG